MRKFKNSVILNYLNSANSHFKFDGKFKIAVKFSNKNYLLSSFLSSSVFLVFSEFFAASKAL
ncbi:MAG: hypothetical protein IJP87_07445, partial [Campylobacter sp.]|nr:hypothetical protein [Campylobacter sp.]